MNHAAMGAAPLEDGSALVHGVLVGIVLTLVDGGRRRLPPEGAPAKAAISKNSAFAFFDRVPPSREGGEGLKQALRLTTLGDAPLAFS